MWIKSCRFLWLRFQFEGRSFLRISFPIPLYVFQELLDCFVDLLTVMKLLDSITGDESYNLVDVTSGRMKVLIKIR